MTCQSHWPDENWLRAHGLSDRLHSLSQTASLYRIAYTVYYVFEPVYHTSIYEIQVQLECIPNLHHEGFICKSEVLIQGHLRMAFS